MMKKYFFFILVVLLCTATFPSNVQAQCAMCTVNAEQSIKNGNNQGAGLNTGILYLLAIPYLLTTVVGVIWYKKYRKKNIKLQVGKQINLN